MLFDIQQLCKSIRDAYPNGWLQLCTQRTGDITVNVMDGSYVKFRGLITVEMKINDVSDHLRELRMKLVKSMLESKGAHDHGDVRKP